MLDRVYGLLQKACAHMTCQESV